MTVRDWQGIGRMPLVRRRPESAAPSAPSAPVAAGYGHLVFWPFAIITILLGMGSGSFLLGLSAAAWAFIMAALGARAPYLVFACFHQAIMAMSGATFLGVFGHYPGDVAMEEFIPQALVLRLLVLLMATVVYCLIVRKDMPGDARLGQSSKILNLSPNVLFLVLLALFSLEWLRVPLQPSSTGGIRQIVLHVINFRLVFFGLFLINVLRSNRKKHYLMLAFISLYIALPAATTGSSGWSSIADIALLLTAGFMVFPTARGAARLTVPVLVVGGMLALFIAMFGLIWEGGMKGTWRTTLRDSGQMSAVTSISQFADQTQGVLSNFDTIDALEKLSARMSSGVGFSSYVINNVPRSIPYANGERMLSAFRNLIPRILYPQKPDLGGDSWLIRKYANVNAAGDESGSSIGLGYPAELYIDFGVFGVIAGGILLGLIFAFGKKIVGLMARNPDLANVCLAITLYASFLSSDASLVKMVSSLVYSLLVFSVAALLVSRFLYVPFRARPVAGSPPAPPGRLTERLR